MSMRKQTETTDAFGQDLNQGALTIVTHHSNRMLTALKTQGLIYDGIAFSPFSTLGLSNPLLHLTDQAEVLSTCGDFYSVWGENQRKQHVIQRNSQAGDLKLLYSIKTGKLNYIASVEHVNGCVCRLDVYDREERKHRTLNLVSTGEAKGMHIISPGLLGILLIDESTGAEKQRFSICLFDIEKENSCMSQQRNLQAIKLVASSFGDFALVLTKEVAFQLEIDLYNKKLDLSEFDLKRFMDPGEECIDAAFLKDTIKLVIVTNRTRVFLFDGRLLISKREFIIPIQQVIPFEETVNGTIQPPSPSKRKSLALPKLIDTSNNQILVLFQDNNLALFSLEAGKSFNFENSYQIPGQATKDQKIKSIKLMNGQAYVEIHRKNIEMWRMTASKSQGQQSEQLCPNVTSGSTSSHSALHFVDMSNCFKYIYTLHKDKNLRCWHLQKGLVYSKTLIQTPTCLSIHPMGFQMAISFKELTRIYELKHDKPDVIYTLKIRNISSVKYSPQGSRLVLCDFPNVYVVCPYSYNTLLTFQTALPGVSEISCQKHFYLLRNEHYAGLYDSRGVKLLQRKVSIFDLYGQGGIAFSDGKKLKKCESKGAKGQTSDDELDMSKILHEDEKITAIKVIQLFGLVLLGTSEGCILELFWPFAQQPASYRYKVSNHSVVYLRIHQTYRQLTCVTAHSEIITLNINQYIEGGQTSAPYAFNSARQGIYEYATQPGFVRRSILNRQYLLQSYGLTGIRINEQRFAEAQEQAANLALVKGEIEYSKQKNMATVASIIDSNKQGNQQQVKENDDEIAKLMEEHEKRMRETRELLKLEHEKAAKNREKAGEMLDMKLLELVRRHQDLTATKQREEVRLAETMVELKLKNQEIMKGLKQDKTDKFAILLEKYGKLNEAVEDDRKKMNGIEQQGELQQKIHRMRIEEELNSQLEEAQKDNQQLNVDIMKNKKGVDNFKKREKYLKSLIEDTEDQIHQLQEDQKQYALKTAEMVDQLRKKEELINQKEEQIKKLLAENKHVKNFKDIHQYLMSEYSNEQIPNELKAEELENKVRLMNSQLLQQIQWRRTAQQQLKQSQTQLSSLKSLTASKRRLLHALNTNLDAVTFMLTQMLRHVPPDNWIDSLRSIYDIRFENSTLNEILTRQVMGVRTIEASEEEVQAMKRVEEMVRVKEDLSKRQVKEQASAKFQDKYREGLFKMYHGENTELVKEYNLLIKEKKLLEQRLAILKDSRAILSAEQEQVAGMVRSVSVTTHRYELKPTPFQRYEQQSLSKKGTEDKSTARMSTDRRINSSALIKGLLKEVDASKSKVEAAEAVRAKIKSFVNPQVSKIVSARQNGKLGAQVLSPSDIFSKLSLQNKQVRTKSQLIKSVIKRSEQPN